MASLKDTDPAIYAAIQKELERQQDGLELIASENIVSTAVLEAQDPSSPINMPKDFLVNVTMAAVNLLTM